MTDGRRQRKWKEDGSEEDGVKVNVEPTDPNTCTLDLRSRRETVGITNESEYPRRPSATTPIPNAFH